MALKNVALGTLNWHVFPTYDLASELFLADYGSWAIKRMLKYMHESMSLSYLLMRMDHTVYYKKYKIFKKKSQIAY